jgi:TPR repeat protein
MRALISGLAALLALTALAAGPPRDHPQGRRGVLERGCQAGREADCFALGTVLAAGEGGPVDWPQALRLYERACPSQPEACYYLGLVYLLGAEVAPDPGRAASFLDRACDRGLVDACIELGTAFDTGGEGDGRLPRDDSRARALFQKAGEWAERLCDAGRLRGCGSLAWLYTTGKGRPKDLVKAAQLIQEGCDGGEMTLCRRLGNLYAAGEGVARDTRRAKELLDAACRRGMGEACRDLKRVKWEEIAGSAISGRHP